jgi:hypothetical protein
MKKATQAQNVSLEQLTELVYQALETEIGGVEIYRTALKCVQNGELRDEWQKYLEQTEMHVERVREICSVMGLDADQDTPGRQVVRHIGKSLVKAMQLALGGDSPDGAELVATECVTLAETKDHMNWELLGKCAEQMAGEAADAIAAAYAVVEREEDEHLYHSAGWSRELWIQALGMLPVLPPPEEKRDVHTAIEAARAKQGR